MKRILVLVTLVVGVVGVILAAWLVGMNMEREERVYVTKSLQELMRQDARLKEADAKLKEACQQVQGR